MLKDEGSSGSGRGGAAGGCRGRGGAAGGWARMCDSCHTAACSVYCRADSAYLCAGCDASYHSANRVASRHERVWVCEACERAPAAFTCKADAAALCTTCDADIHSANPLARRHHRVPILPISGFLFGPSPAHPGKPLAPPEVDVGDGFIMAHEPCEEVGEEDEDETSSWLLLNPVKNNNNNNNNNNNQSNGGFMLGGEVEEYLDLVEYNSGTENQYQSQYYQQLQQQQHYSAQQNIDVSDRVVPVQCVTVKEKHQDQPNLQLEMEYEISSKAGFSYTGSISHSHSVSFSSMDASIVPDSTMSDISNTHSRPPKGTIDLFSSPPLQMGPQFSVDREARVLRYKEKRKMRKFEKTIRYASRKAYAETRPRIKGRFARRTDVEVEVDQMFVTSVIAESGYGIVPSF